MKNEKLRRFPYVPTSPNPYARMQEDGGPPSYSQTTGISKMDCQDTPAFIEVNGDGVDEGASQKFSSALIIPHEPEGRKVVRVTIHHGTSVDPEVIVNNRKLSLHYPFGSKYLCLRLFYILAFFFLILFLWKSLLFLHVLLYED